MRNQTRKSYERRIANLEEGIINANKRADSALADARMWEDSYHSVAGSRRIGEGARKWAIEEAIRISQPNLVVNTAQRIVEFVYGPDMDASREAENP